MQITDSQKIKIIRKALKLTQEELASAIGITQTSVSQIENGKNGFSFDVFKALVNKMGVEPEYLLNGVEPILKSSNYSSSRDTKSISKSISNRIPISSQIGNSASLSVKEPDSKYQTTPGVVTVDEHGDDNIVMVDVKAAAGYPTRYLEPTFYKELPAFKMPGVVTKNGVFRAFQVDGDSMVDTLDHGDWVICRRLDNLLEIREGYIHVIVNTEEVSVKRLLNRIEERGKIVLISDNEEYPTRELNAEEVSEIWLVRAKIGYQLGARSKNMMRIINNLQADMVDIKSRIQSLERKSGKSSV